MFEEILKEMAERGCRRTLLCSITCLMSKLRKTVNNDEKTDMLCQLVIKDSQLF